MSPVLPLAWSFVRSHALRSALTVLTVLATTATVVWVVAGYEGLVQSYDAFKSRALGRYTLSVDAIRRAADREVPPTVVEELRGDPRVRAADAMWAERTLVHTDRATYVGERELLLLATDAAEPPFDLVTGRWIAASTVAGEEPPGVCASAAIAEHFGLAVGDTLRVGRDDRAQPLRIVGIVDNPPTPITGRTVGTLELPGPGIAGIYLTMADAARLHHRPPRTTFVGLVLADGVDVHAFRHEWAPRLAQGAEPQQFQEDYDLEEELDEAAAARNVALQSYGTTALAMLLAFLVTFNTLNMGVTERVRTFALLRAVALTRRQVVGVVFVEGLLLAGIGFAGGVGVGAGVVESVEIGIPRLFRHGATVGGLGIGLAALASLGAAALAEAFPAWRAARVRPLDAIAPRVHTSGTRRLPLVATAVGVAMVVVAVVLGLLVRPAFDGPVVLQLLGTYTLLGGGLLLLSPAAVVLAERTLAPLLARVLGLDPLLLQEQLQSRLWRSVGAMLGLSLGLGLLVAVHAWGFTMLRTFVPGSWAPDAVLVLETPLADEELAALASLPEVGSAGVMPVVVEQPRLREDLTGSAERASIIRQDNIILVGVDPAKAFGGPAPLLACEWVDGTAAYAAAALREGHACVVPDHFLRETGLAVGDTFEVVPPEDPLRPRSYRIAASIRLPGWHWQTKMTAMRVRTHRAAALVFADIASVRADFSLPRASHAFVDLRDGDDGGDGGDAFERAVRRVLPSPAANGAAQLPAGAAPAGVVTVGEVRDSVLSTAGRYLWAISVLPLLVLAIASLGLLNLMVASVRARRWETGVLRAIGFGRGTVRRMIVAEALLIGAAAALLGIVGGLLAGGCGTGAASQMSFFGGMDPELTVPWSGIVVGTLATALFAAAAAWLPAWSQGRTAPLTLLQQGRGST